MNLEASLILVSVVFFLFAFFPTVYVFRLSSDHMFNSKIENFFKRSFQNGSHENGARVNNIEKWSEWWSSCCLLTRIYCFHFACVITRYRSMHDVELRYGERDNLTQMLFLLLSDAHKQKANLNCFFFSGNRLKILRNWTKLFFWDFFLEIDGDLFFGAICK